MEEIWKDIPGYEGLYQVSSMGNIRGLEHFIITKNKKRIKYKPRNITLHTDFYGYNYVWLHKNGIKKRIKVHRIVASVFIQNPELKPEIDHINAVRTDNRIENLRWVTRSENNSNPIFIKRQRVAKLGKRLSEESKLKISLKCKGHRVNREAMSKSAIKHPVIAFSLNGDYIAEFNSIKEASILTNTDASCISDVCRGKRNKAGGYKWKYKNEQ